MAILKWLTVLLAFLALGFIGFAFRPGMKVKPDANRDIGRNNASGQAGGDGSSHGFDGHS